MILCYSLNRKITKEIIEDQKEASSFSANWIIRGSVLEMYTSLDPKIPEDDVDEIDDPMNID